MFEYYTKKESKKHAYYTIPKELFTNPMYVTLPTDAKLLYGLLRDRNQLSIENKWFDELNHIYIIFTREEACELLKIKKDKAISLFKVLAEYNLIKEVRQGLNKPNIIYVGKIIYGSRKSEKSTSRGRKNRTQKVEKIDSNKNDINKTYYNNSAFKNFPQREFEEQDFDN